MASINDDAPALESTTSTGIRKGRAVLLKHLKHPELNESLKSQQQVTFRLVKSGKRSVLSFYSKIWIFNFFHDYSEIRMICLLIFENYPKIQKFSQLVRWVLITLLSFEGIPNAKIVQVCKQEHITSKYVSQFFQNNLHSIRKRQISLISTHVLCI